MSLNYHELTMEESKNSPDRKRQFLVISVIGFGVILTSVISSGMLFPIILLNGVFPGGEYRYRSKSKDYSASMALFRETARLLGVGGPKGQWGDFIYGIYHDDAKVVGAKSRFSVGVLLDDELKETYEPRFQRMSKQRTYEKAMLPSVPAVIAHFPFTNGVVSALVFQFKVLPAFYSYVRTHSGKDEHPIVLSTCSIQESMCTHYAPLISSKEFMLGKSLPDEYAEKIKIAKQKAKDKDALEVGSIMKGFKKLVGLKEEL